MRTENPNDCCRENKLRRGRETHLPRRSLWDEGKKSNWKGEAILRVARPYF